MLPPCWPWAVGLLDFFRNIELQAYDLRVAATARPSAPSKDVVLIAIDNESIRRMEPLVGRWRVRAEGESNGEPGRNRAFNQQIKRLRQSQITPSRTMILRTILTLEVAGVAACFGKSATQCHGPSKAMAAEFSYRCRSKSRTTA